MGARADQKFIVYDTDGHGGLSGYIAIRAFEKAGYKDLRHYSHFEPVRPPQTPSRPVTNPMWLATFLPELVAPGFADLVVIDIPIDIQNPKRFVDILSSYVFGNHRTIFIDHHGHSEWTRILFESGVETIIQPTSYDMSLYLPRALGVCDRDDERLALIAAICDFDESVAHKVSSDFEELVAEYFDSAWKFGFRSIDEIRALEARFGNVGAIVEWFKIRNLGPEEILELAREYGQAVPLIDHETRGDVVVARGTPPQGQAWKALAKLVRVTGAPVATMLAQTPRGISVIVACDWKKKAQYATIVDDVVLEVAKGRPVVGHPGAKSIAVTSREEGEELLEELVAKLNAEISRRIYACKVAHLINVEHVSEALHEDFRQILQRLTEILETQREMYKEYLELKRKQVELLERVSEERRYD